MKLYDLKSFQRIPVIYGIENTETSKWYIGSCLDMKDRFQRHRYYLRHNMHHSEKLQRSYNMHGEKAFEVHILHILTADEDRFVLEQKYIEKYNSVSNGYNMLEKCIYVDNFKLSEVAKSNFLKYIETLEKRVIAIDRFTGKIENAFNSITKAAEYYHTSTSNISQVCKGLSQYCKDKVFVYEDDFDETKDYKVQHHCKGKEKTESQKEKMRHNKRCCTICKISANGDTVNQYYSIANAAMREGVSRDRMRYIINSNKELNGFTYVRK